MRLAHLFLALLALVPAHPRALPAPEPTRVLFIGNSYTYYNNLPSMLAELALGEGKPLVTRMVAPGGWRLRDHLEAEAVQALGAEKWDFVVLQEQSTLGATLYVDGQTRVGTDAVFQPAAKEWIERIRAAGAQPVLYLTWPRRHAPQDQETLTRAVLHAAGKEARVAPAGPAWALARARLPALELYDDDGSHPSPAGTYLAACALYATLFETSPVGLPETVLGVPVDLSTARERAGERATLVALDSAQARTLQECAWKAVEELAKKRKKASPAPEPPALAPLADGAPLTAESLAGSWSGSLLLSPSGPARVTLALDAPASAEAAWWGQVQLEFHSKDVRDLEVELEGLKVTERRLSFTLRSVVFELDVEFEAVLGPDGKLAGLARTPTSSPDRPLLLGHWSAARDGG